MDAVTRPEGLDLDYEAEFQRNWGIKASGAGAAYAAGATGRGVKIAIIDTGMESASEDVLSNVSPQSIDLISDRTRRNERPHGANIAAALAAARDGSGLVGIAPEVTVLSVRADLDVPCLKGECILSGMHIAQGIDYAIEQGSKVIILSLAGTKRLPSLEPALLRAVQAGVVIVAASGNQGRHESGWPARYAAEPEYGGMVLAVGASNRTGQITRYSNRAGRARHGYIVAPGDNIIVSCDSVRCSKASGTSYATAYVAGAIALMLDAFPHLDGRQAAQMLLKTARDAGPRGTDSVFGRGHINIARAFLEAQAQTERQLMASAAAD
ncbi:MAG TPA: S8 family peptidase [Pedomonas sp.]|uniref:S8 family peptidase n=1 Tax=Pedomonas sp. TaxID=2976421 RepID=UPI002F403143